MVETTLLVKLGVVAVGGTVGFFALPLAGAALGVTAVGPVAGGTFAAAQAAGSVVAGGSWAILQSLVMGGGSAVAVKTGTTLVGMCAGLLI